MLKKLLLSFLLLGSSVVARASITASTSWYVRTDGNANNGGGFDPSIVGAGISYGDQSSAQLTLTDLNTASAAATCITSPTGGFTGNMVGNAIQISTAGLNFTTGYYFVIASSSSNTAVLDRSPTNAGAGSNGGMMLGGAFVSLQNLLSAGAGSGIFTNWKSTSPLQPGNTVLICGTGSLDPPTTNYDWSPSGSYWSPVSGTVAGGRITFLGYNGRPSIYTNGIIANSPSYWTFNSIKFVFATSAGFGTLGLTNSSAGADAAYNLIVDLNGNDGVAIQAGFIVGCEVRNTGGGAVGSQSALEDQTYSGVFLGNYVHGVRGNGISVGGGTAVHNNLIVNNGHYGITVTPLLTGAAAISNNTLDNNGSDGIVFPNAGSYYVSGASVYNNVITNSGRYGIDIANGTAALNNSRKVFLNDNFFLSNTSGNLNNVSSGTLDVQLSTTPYTCVSCGNYALNSVSGGGAAVKAAAYPSTWLSGSTTAYLDGGAAQSQGSGTGASGSGKAISFGWIGQ